MVKVRLETSREHIAELARLRDPVGAIEELIWNALDADAGRVVVELERNDLGGVERVRVEDDGSGMSAEQCGEYFRPIGTSWKKSARESPLKKRAPHGKNGRGRVRAFALGVEVRWTSVSPFIATSRTVLNSRRASQAMAGSSCSRLLCAWA
ncbi:ATP-binding protein [Streptomyces sp. NPDC018693]|uniref:ATP-binding protein n=1 Tax=unclassified Streptomyces TaxID=2593676 RepID=UPI0037ABD07B